jgi:hypothetical protein
METMREAWTDDRLDDLNHKVDEGFRKVDKRFDRLEDEIDARFNRVDDKFDSLEARLDERFDAMHRTMILFSGGVLAALIGAVAALIAMAFGA